MLRTHVADRALAGAGDRPRTRAEVLNDGVGSTLYSEDLADLEDDVLASRPALQLTRQAHTDQLGRLHLPRHSSHHIHRIRAAHAYSDHAKAAGIHRV